MEQITRKEWDKLILLVFFIIVMIQSFTLCKVEFVYYPFSKAKILE